MFVVLVCRCNERATGCNRLPLVTPPDASRNAGLRNRGG